MRKREHRRVSAVTSLAALVAAALIPQAVASAKATTIKYSLWWKGPGTENAIAQFEKAYPDIKVEVLLMPDYFPKLLSMQAGGVPPDVADFQTWDVYTLGDPRLMEDLNKYIKRDKYSLTDFIPGYIDMYTYGGKLIGLPWGYNTSGLAYNITMFERNGLPPPLPTSAKGHLDWSDFLSIAKKMTKDDNGDGKTDAWGWGEDAYWQYPNWICQNAGGFISPDLTKVLVTGDNTVAALQFQADLWQKYKVVDPDYYVTEFPNVQGKIAMCLGGGWMFPTWRQYKKLKFDIGPMFWEKTPYANMIGVGVGILRQSKHKEAAWTFVKWLTSVDGQRALHKEPNLMPSRLSVARSDVFMKATPPEHNEYLIQEALNARIEQFPNIQPARIMDPFKVELYRIVGGKTTAKEGMNRAAPVMQKALDEWNKRRRK